MPDCYDIKVLFDGECPVCRREIDLLKRLDRRNRIATEDISALGFDPGRFGLTFPEVMGTIHGILPNGQVLDGMEVFRHLYKAIGLGWMLSWTRWPLARPFIDNGYQWLASHRLHWTGQTGVACALDRCALAQNGNPSVELAATNGSDRD